MAERSPTGYYRRSKIYKKRKLRKILIISSIVLASALLIFLFIGNILKNKAENVPLNEGTTEDNAQHMDTSADAAYSINGYYIGIGGTTFKEYTEKLDVAIDDGATSVSISLTDSDGKLLYASDIANQFGYQNSSDNLFDLKSAIRRNKSHDLFTSVCIRLTSVLEKDDKIRSVKLSYEAALIAELAEYGAGDIVIICPQLNTDRVDDLLKLSDNIKSLNSDAVIGITFTSEFIDSENSAADIDRLMEKYDFSAFDLSNSGGTPTDEYIQSQISDPGRRYYILRYNTRILLPTCKDETMKNKISEILDANSISNKQAIV